MQRQKLVRQSVVTEEDDGDDDGGTGGEPAGVGADVSGLDAADEPVASAGGGGEAGGGASDEASVDEAVQEEARDDEKRGDDEAAVDFVDPVFVVEEGVAGAVFLCEGGGGAGLAVVEEVGDEEAESRGQEGDGGESEFSVSVAVPNVLGRERDFASDYRMEDWVEKVFDFVVAAKSCGDAYPAADDREDGRRMRGTVMTQGDSWTPWAWVIGVGSGSASRTRVEVLLA